jgi:hypothetical protein
MPVEVSAKLDKRFEPRRRPSTVMAIMGHPGKKEVDRSVIHRERSETTLLSQVVKPAGGEQTDIVSTSVIPYVGAVIAVDNGYNVSTEFGVGIRLIDEAKTVFFGLPDVGLPIQAWRAVRLLEAAERIHPETLEAVWYAAGRDTDPAKGSLVKAFAEDIGQERFERLREQVFNKAPSNEEMRRMFTQFNLAGVRVDPAEWEKEIANGRMHFDQDVQGYYDKNKEFLRECEAKEQRLREYQAFNV